MNDNTPRRIAHGDKPSLSFLPPPEQECEQALRECLRYAEGVDSPHNDLQEIAQICRTALRLTVPPPQREDDSA